MAEGLFRHLAGSEFEVYSAGTKPAQLRPEAVAVMREIGIDISGHRSKSVDEFIGQELDTVITVCGNADQVCPIFPGQVNRHHWPFFDPAKATGTTEEQLKVFRQVRDEIALSFKAYGAGWRDSRR